VRALLAGLANRGMQALRHALQPLRPGAAHEMEQSSLVLQLATTPPPLTLETKPAWSADCAEAWSPPAGTGMGTAATGALFSAAAFASSAASLTSSFPACSSSKESSRQAGRQGEAAG